MKLRRIHHFFLCFIAAMSLSSSIYLNDQAKVLESQGYETSLTLFEEDFENMMPEINIVDKVVNHLKRIVPQ